MLCHWGVVTTMNYYNICSDVYNDRDDTTKQRRHKQLISLNSPGFSGLLLFGNEWKLPVGGYEIDYIRSIYELNRIANGYRWHFR